MAFGELIYYQVTSRWRPGLANLFIVETSEGPVRALRLNHPTKTWTFDPMTVHLSLMDDLNDPEEDLIKQVNRTQAEKIAVLLESVLPSEAELRILMQESAGDLPG